MPIPHLRDSAAGSRFHETGTDLRRIEKTGHPLTIRSKTGAVRLVSFLPSAAELRTTRPVVRSTLFTAFLHLHLQFSRKHCPSCRCSPHGDSLPKILDRCVPEQSFNAESLGAPSVSGDGEDRGSARLSNVAGRAI